MKLFFDFLPIILFFLVFKLYGIYSATAIAIASSLLQVAYIRIKYQRYDTVQLVSCSIITVLGGATLFFQNPLFIKWKPTGLYWIFALLFIGSSWIGPKTLIQKIMEKNISLPAKIWSRLNISWALFFIVLGMANLYVAYFYDTNVWVNFKLFGGIGLTFLFVFVQALFLAKHIEEETELEKQS